jgi:pimeloyl-ACP methyl ester carboxylesterase
MNVHKICGLGSDATGTTQMVDIGGRRLALTCEGRGPITVVLETGLGAESCEWAAVRKGVATVARVFSYDRANRGESDPAPRPRRANEMVHDLELLLGKAGLSPPYILVGHSFGGLLVRLFANRRTDDVAGLVLVDSMSDQQFDIFGRMFPPPTPLDPLELQKTRAFWTGGWRDSNSTQEGIDFPVSLAEGRAVTTLGSIPIRILDAGTFLNQPLVPPAFRSVLQERWDDLQADFLTLSNRASIIRAPRSGHFIQRDDPHLVIDTIKAVVAEAAEPGG